MVEMNPNISVIMNTSGVNALVKRKVIRWAQKVYTVYKEYI